MCTDYPISVPREVTKLDYPLTCDAYESGGFCVDGDVNADSVTGGIEEPQDLYEILFENEYDDSRTAVEACCICGGGARPDDDNVLSNQLKEWKIILGDGTPTIGTKRVSNYDPFLPQVTSYEFIRCRRESIYGGKADCCNGLDSICDLRVNEVLFATLHNGMNEFSNGGYVTIHKEFELERALEAGYRAFKLDICNCAGEYKFCFGKQKSVLNV